MQARHDEATHDVLIVGGGLVGASLAIALARLGLSVGLVEAAAHGALQPGGLLAIASSRPVPDIERKLARAGFETARHEIDATPNARRPRRHFLWLARKGNSGD